MENIHSDIYIIIIIIIINMEKCTFGHLCPTKTQCVLLCSLSVSSLSIYRTLGSLVTREHTAKILIKLRGFMDKSESSQVLLVMRNIFHPAAREKVFSSCTNNKICTWHLFSGET